MIAYVDTSVLLRIVFGEADQLDIWREIEPISSELTRVEALRAVERYRLLGAFDDQLVAERRAAILGALETFAMTPITSSILDRAGDPFPTSVATLDAIHLSTALVVREESPGVVFATHDAKLGQAASAVGFEVQGV